MTRALAGGSSHESRESRVKVITVGWRAKRLTEDAVGDAEERELGLSATRAFAKVVYTTVNLLLSVKVCLGHDGDGGTAVGKLRTRVGAYDLGRLPVVAGRERVDGTLSAVVLGANETGTTARDGDEVELLGVGGGAKVAVDGHSLAGRDGIVEVESGEGTGTAVCDDLVGRGDKGDTSVTARRGSASLAALLGVPSSRLTGRADLCDGGHAEGKDDVRVTSCVLGRVDGAEGANAVLSLELLLDVVEVGREDGLAVGAQGEVESVEAARAVVGLTGRRGECVAVLCDRIEAGSAGPGVERDTGSLLSAVSARGDAGDDDVEVGAVLGVPDRDLALPEVALVEEAAGAVEGGVLRVEVLYLDVVGVWHCCALTDGRGQGEGCRDDGAECGGNESSTHIEI